MQDTNLLSYEQIGQRTLASALNRIISLRLRLEELNRNDFPSSAPTLLVEILLKIVNSLYQKLQEVQVNFPSKYQSLDEIQDQIMQLLILNNATAKLSRYLEIVNSARTEMSDWSLVNSLVELGEQVARQTQIIIHPQWSYNHSYRELLDPLMKLASAIGPEAERNLFKGFAPYFVVLTYPVLEKDFILHNAALAHELGHFIDRVHTISKFVNQQPIMDADLVREIVDATISEEIANGKQGLKRRASQTVKSRVYEKSTRIVRKWTQEIIADILSVCLLGPAAVFAFEEVVLRLQPLDDIEYMIEDYPPPKLRLKIMLDQLDLVGFSSALTTLKDEHNVTGMVDKVLMRLTELRGLVNPVTSLTGDLYCNLGINALTRGLPFIIDKVSALNNEGWYCSKEDLHDAFLLIELLEHDLPPSELPVTSAGKKVPDIHSIINAGWFYTIALQSDPGASRGEKSEEIYAHFVKTNKLVKKAIEASQVTNEYNHRKGRNEYKF